MPSRDDQKNEVQQATDIVRLIGEQVSLKARGKEFLGLCPFHDDKNPSMHVSPTKQIYKCFSCGAGGDVFSFVMNYHKMSFPDALKLLAERAGIKLVQGRGGGSQEEESPTERQRIARANSQAVEFFRALLRHPDHGRTARDYIAKRRISAEMVEAFQIGYAADRWDGLAMMINEKAWDVQAFAMAGLISPRERSHDLDRPSFYDRMRHRLIFPIFDAIGRPIAFGGRKLRDEDEPKYLNSPETVLFNKSATLYGLHLAKKPIIDTKTAVIVEGYTDVIACHQAGIRNVVATLGTALTLQHVQALRHFAEKVVLIYDGDEAGQKAADRAVEIFLTGEMDVAFVVLPEGVDPAELFEMPDGVEQWNKSIAASVDALEFQFRRVRVQLDAATTVTGRQRVAEEYLTKLASFGLSQTNVIRKAMVIQRLASMLHLSEQTIQDLLKRLAPVRRSQNPRISTENGVQSGSDNEIDNLRADVASPQSQHKMKALARAERQVIGCLLREPGLFHQMLSDGRTLDEAVTPAELITPIGQRLYGSLHQRLSDGIEFTMSTVLADLASQNQTDLTALATQAEAEVEAAAGDAAHLRQILIAAGDAIRQYREEIEYIGVRQSFEDKSGKGFVNDDQGSELLRKLIEHRRTHPSPTRIARLSS